MHRQRTNGIDLSQFLRDPSPHHHQAESPGSLRKQISQMLRKHHQSIERNNHTLQPVSPASYGSSLEVATYNKPVTPSSSLEFRRRPSREPHSYLKTSTQLLKVLNRIWSLEEQHAANISLIKTLKTELAHSRARIKELVRYQYADRHEIERISSAVQSARKELEDERKLRKRSETLHRKLARELSEAKSTLANCIKELERGAKSKKMMEMLCDEFAKGIKSYQEEIRGLSEDRAGPNEGNQMVLHIAESWLHQRMHMNYSSVLDKFVVEIETFLQQKRTENRRSSLESVPYNTLSAPPRDVECEEDSDSNCFELKKPAEDETEKLNEPKKDDLCDEKPKEKIGSPLSFQVGWGMSSNGKKKGQAMGEDEEEKDVNSNTIDQCTNKNDVIRTHRRLLSETQEASCSYPSCRRQASPVRQWTSRTITPDRRGLSETSVKDKLAKGSRSRLRLFRG